ncbi:MAG: hypothetical protein ABIX01_00935 [Chitinophagaceae bacterium]
MNEESTLHNPITLNATGTKYNAIAIAVQLTELRKNASFFQFDFMALKKEGYDIYKICRENDLEIILGLVAFRPSPGVLDCANMETSNINKSGISLYGGTGKALVALCCLVSFNMGFECYITFEAKNRLVPYYKRLGAVMVMGKRMAIATREALKLVNLYF